MPATIPQEWVKEFEERRKKTPDDESPKGLIEQKAQSCISKAQDFVPPKPQNYFMKDLEEIKKKVNEKYRNDGAAVEFRNDITAFLNDYSSKLRVSDVVPKEFQVSLLENAAKFDKTGEIIGELCDLFQGKYKRQDYRIPGEKRRCCAAAKQLRKVAHILLGQVRP
jgi:hypothetical protein